MADSAAPGAKLNVFISYSRDDLSFADQLNAALEVTGFETTLDRHGISGGEDWKSRLGSLIRSADTVVFVLSPSSARSEVCAWEIDEAIRLRKRIVPVLCRPLDPVSAPAPISALNYIFFYDEPKSPGSGFGAGLGRLVSALATDFEWLREHTRYLERAMEWEAGGRATNRLLAGPDVATARVWLTHRPKNAPEPTGLHLDFIRASEVENNRLQNAEAQRLRELLEAQSAREAAFAEKAHAQAREALQAHRVVRRTQAGLAAAVLLSLGVAWFGIDAQRQRATALRALAELQQEQDKRTAQVFQLGWHAVAGLNERTEDETYEVCGSIQGLQGVRRLYCEVANVVSLQTLATLSGVAVFQSGPHVLAQGQSQGQGRTYQYNLRSHQIGRYNPAFIEWFSRFAVPAMDNEAFRNGTAELFKRHIQSVALNYYAAYLKLFDPAQREPRQRLVRRFQDDLSRYTPEMELARRNIKTTDMGEYMRIWGTSPSYKLQESLGSLGGTASRGDTPGIDYGLHVAMSFWVRRQLDGTHRALFELLCNLLRAYGALPAAGVPAGLDDR